MPIGSEPNDRRFTYYQLSENKNDVTLDTQKLVKIFGIPMGMHVVIEQMEVILEAGDGIEILFDQRTGRRGGAGIAELSGGESSMPIPRHLVVTVPATQVEYAGQNYFLGIPVYDEIQLYRGDNTVDVGFHFYYHFEPGAMMWLDEWAALIRDKSNVAQRNVREYKQVGDYFQIGRRPNE